MIQYRYHESKYCDILPDRFFSTDLEIQIIHLKLWLCLLCIHLSVLNLHECHEVINVFLMCESSNQDQSCTRSKYNFHLIRVGGVPLCWLDAGCTCRVWADWLYALIMQCGEIISGGNFVFLKADGKCEVQEKLFFALMCGCWLTASVLSLLFGSLNIYDRVLLSSDFYCDVYM